MPFARPAGHHRTGGRDVFFFFFLFFFSPSGKQARRPATLTIRPGFPVRVMVTRDLILEPLGEIPDDEAEA